MLNLYRSVSSSDSTMGASFMAIPLFLRYFCYFTPFIRRKQGEIGDLRRSDPKNESEGDAKMGRSCIFSGQDLYFYAQKCMLAAPASCGENGFFPAFVEIMREFLHFRLDFRKNLQRGNGLYIEKMNKHEKWYCNLRGEMIRYKHHFPASGRCRFCTIYTRRNPT